MALLGRCVASCTAIALATVTAAPSHSAEVAQGHRVVIETRQSGVVLERLVASTPGDAPRWARVCVAPCGVELPAFAGAEEYRLSGDGLRSTSSFTIDRASKVSTIKASLGTSWQFWTGAGVVATGVALGVGGALTVSADANASSTVGEEERESVNVGWILTAAGVVLIGAGVMLMMANTNVVSVDGAAVARGKGATVARRRPEAGGFRLTPNGFVF